MLLLELSLFESGVSGFFPEGLEEGKVGGVFIVNYKMNLLVVGVLGPLFIL